MSFALSMDGGRLEWGSDSLDTIFAQRSNIASPSFLAMLRDVIRFGKEAPKVLEPSVHHLYRNMTLGEYLEKECYSKSFTQNYVLPMCAAVWSVPNAQVSPYVVGSMQYVFIQVLNHQAKLKAGRVPLITEHACS
jgi:predicted NAD/FAD-binding protein